MSDLEYLMEGNTEMLGVAMGALAVYLVVALVVVVLILVAQWKIFKKAGEPGWKCLIPIYSQYVQYRFTWKTSMFWVLIALAAVTAVLEGAFEVTEVSAAGSSAVTVLIMLINLVIMIATLVIEIIAMNKLAKSFGKGAGFTVGLILLQPIFLMILGFGSSEYLGADL